MFDIPSAISFRLLVVGSLRREVLRKLTYILPLDDVISTDEDDLTSVLCRWKVLSLSDQLSKERDIKFPLV